MNTISFGTSIWTWYSAIAPAGLWTKPPAGTYITKAQPPGDAAKLNSPMWRFGGGRRTHAAYF